MSSSTPNIGLTLPTGGERVSRQIINENNTKIDTYAGELSEQIGTLNSKIPTESKTYQFTSVPYINGSGARVINCPVPLNKTPIITNIQSSGGVDVTGDFDIVHNSEGQLFVYTWVATFDGVPINVNYHF